MTPYETRVDQRGGFRRDRLAQGKTKQQLELLRDKANMMADMEQDYDKAEKLRELAWDYTLILTLRASDYE